MQFPFKKITIAISIGLLFSMFVPINARNSSSINKLENGPTSLTELPTKKDSIVKEKSILRIDSPVKNGESFSYMADIPYGFIGTSDENPVDNPFDNIFHIHLPDLSSNNIVPYLTYELYGVNNHKSVARSINRSQALGAHFVKIRHVWSTQKEAIPLSLLRVGENVIRFSLPDQANYCYKVRNVRIILQEEVQPDKAILINQPDSVFFEQEAYLKGMLKLPEALRYDVSGEILLTCGTQSIPVYNGEFEAVLPNPGKNAFKTFLKVSLPNGEILSKEVVFIHNQTADQVYLPKEKGWKTTSLFNPSNKLEVVLSKNNRATSVRIPANSLPISTPISITALRGIDLPALNPDLVNITAGSAGYRFLPDGSKFSNAVHLSIPYDSTLIPEGYTVADIHTYYFDESSRKWISLPLDSVNVEADVVSSKSTHFTDMINGIIKVPESPQTQGYTPTFIKDFKPANPSAGISLIDPPSANSRGNASISLPLKLPTGRLGMEPNLAIQYNNSYGNGWLGLGWNLFTPSISIDTRWGVPRYDSEMESETYLLSGEQLAPLTNRDILIPRGADKEFFPRVEGSFEKTIRHGSHPNNYWWEVISKRGTRSFYGGLPENGVVDSAVLKDKAGNISYWALVQIRDLDDNTQRYQYTIVADSGVEGTDAMTGQQLYLDEISYTGNSTTEGPYKVSFLRDRQLGEVRRKDVMIDCRLGYKMVTADLLREIRINLNNELIRTYELNYKEGAFYKNLLNSISELDDKGEIFYTHTFDYFDDVNAENGYTPLSSQESWSIEDDGIKGDIVNPLPWTKGQGSALSTQKSNSIGGGLAITIGFIGDGWSKQGTLGGSFEFDRTTTEGLVSMVDINGDNLPDKVVKKGNRLFYRPNIKNQSAFGSLIPIIEVDDFNTSTTQTFSGGVQIIPGGGVFLGYNYGNGTTKTETYFSDFNGDGLIDISSKGQAFFNQINENGYPSFRNNSTLTPNPLFLDGAIDKAFFAPDTELQQRQEQEFPLQDIVRFWIAPFDGKVSLSAPVHLIEVADSLKSDKEDGVRVSIQLRDKIIWNSLIPAGDFNNKTPSSLDSLDIQKGDRIYFRVQSIYNGENDEVFWDPTINYVTAVSPTLDANNKNTSRYQASEDFVFSDVQPLGISKTGTIEIAGDFIKNITSDEVVLRINRSRDLSDTVKDTIEVFRKVFSGNTTVNGPLETIKFDVQERDVLCFELDADSYIDRTALEWLPTYKVTAANAADTLGMNQNSIIVPENNNYNTWLIPTPVIKSTKKDTITITPIIDIPPSSPFGGINFALLGLSGTITFTVKGIDTIYAKRQITLTNGAIKINPSSGIPIVVLPGELIFAEYHVESNEIAEVLSKLEATNIKIQNGLVSTTQIAGLYTNSKGDELTPIFRGWGQFSITGDKGDGPLDESELNFKKAEEIDYEQIFADTARYQEEPDALVGLKDATKIDFSCLVANGQKRWLVGKDTSVFVTPTNMSSSRLFLHDVSVDSLMVTEGASLKTVTKISRTETHSFSVGVGISGSYSNVSNIDLLDIMDMNGDDYPDILHVNDVQFTLPNGALEETGRMNHLGAAESKGNSFGLSAGGVFLKASASNKRQVGKKNANNRKTKGGAGQGHKTSKRSIGLTGTGSISTNNQSAKSTWIDINGDGLPDKVDEEGKVALNLGYSFTPFEQWNLQEINSSSSTSLGGGLGVNLFQGTIIAGFGLSRSDDNTSFALQDINGDGLPDQLTATDTGLQVKLNTGNGFEAPINWRDKTAISSTLSTGESLSAAFTIPIIIPIPFYPLKLCINPSFSLGHGVSGQTNQILDMNGDGFPDFVKSDSDGNLLVSASTIGRTNMLRKVESPLGAHFSIDYERLGNSYNLSHSVWVMKNLEIFDGVQGDGADTLRSSFSYGGGYYDRREREFFGFDKVITKELNTLANDVVYRSHEERFLNRNFYEKGLPKSSTLRDADGNIFTQTKNSYELRNVRDSVFFPALVQMERLYYEGAATAEVSTYTRYEYNELGNITKIIDIGDGRTQDLLTTTISYHDNDALYIKNVAALVEVSTIEGVKRKHTSTIDNKGRYTQISQFLADGTSADFNLEYDEFGSLSKLIHPSNYKGERMFYNYVYDDIIHNYIIKSSDAYGYSDSTAYEYRFGNVIGMTSMHGEQVKFNIDNRGRLSSVTGPYELAAGKPYTIACEYFPEAPTPYAITHHYDSEYEEDIDFFTFIDGLGRAIQVKKLGSLFTEKDQVDELKMIISGKQNYDAFGRIVEHYFPATELLGFANTNFSSASGGIMERINYDVLDRPIKQELADGATSKITYSAEDNLLITQAIDALNNQVKKFKDVRGRQRILEQYGGSEGIIITHYAYNALNERLQVEDHNGNKIISTYDNFGRRLSVQHPDAGLTEFWYDLASNLVQKITPQIRKQVPDGGAIKYAYDYNRITGIDYPIQYQNNVSFEYGPPNSGNQTGRLVLQKDASGGREYYYGKLGEITKEIRTVLINSVFYTTYVSEQEYDTWNRIKKMTYPDGEEVSYHYNRAGGLYSVNGLKKGNTYQYVDRVGYDEFEERVYLKYGNGTEMTYNFDDQRRRLDLLQAFTTEGKPMMNNSYRYDPVSNITSIINNVTAEEGKLGGHASQEYTYDNLYRLIEATGLYEGIRDTATYNLEMDYDNLFNIVNKKLFHKDTLKSYEQAYLYDGAAPHQAIQIGDKKRIFDLNGNLTVDGNRELFWDEENRLMGIVDEGILHEYTYDAGGERVVKSYGGIQGTWLNGAPAGTIDHYDNYTVYVSPYLISRKNSFTKHIYVEGERIATKVGDGSFTNISFPEPALTAGGVNYIQRAKQLKANRVDYYTSLGVSPGPPTQKLFYAEPQNNGIAAPILVDSTAADIPLGWPGNTTEPIDGPPVFVSPIPSNEEVKAGYGFRGTGHFFEASQYFFHGDHLGSTSYVTNTLGEVDQHVEYVAFGETLFEERKSSFATPYLYNAKELDSETGLYYYGARYYDGKASLWQSVDPLWELPDEVNKSPYAYVANNPIKYVDPDGRAKTYPKRKRVKAIKYNISKPKTVPRKTNWTTVRDATIASSKGQSQIRINRKIGRAAEKHRATYLEVVKQRKVEREVPMEFGPSKIKGRIDVVSMDKPGKLKVEEVKSSYKAPLTKNQRFYLPELARNGGTVTSDALKAFGFSKGSHFKPYKVQIVRFPGKSESGTRRKKVIK